MWHNAKTHPPKVDKRGESEVVLCVEENIPWPFVGFLSGGEWHVAHHSAPSIGRPVTHWSTLPVGPQDDMSRVLESRPYAECESLKRIAGVALPVETHRIIDRSNGEWLSELQLSPDAAWESAASKLPSAA